jgi:hypothetical protein
LGSRGNSRHKIGFGQQKKQSPQDWLWAAEETVAARLALGSNKAAREEKQ